VWVFIAIAAAVIVLAAAFSAGLFYRRRAEKPAGPSRSLDSGSIPGQAENTAGPLAEPIDQRFDSQRSGNATIADLPPSAMGFDEAATTLERPEPSAGRLVRLRSRLARAQSGFGAGLLTLLSRERLDDQTWEEVEDTLLSADLGVASASELVKQLRTRARVEGIATAAQARSILRQELISLVDPSRDRLLRTERHIDDGRPAVVLVVGVNGTGKTTTVGKLARVLVADDRDVILAAADTFRAAAADQLTTWGDRVGVPTIRGAEGGDPASVAFEAVKVGIDQEVDTVIVDTAGRLQTKVGLMDELGKVKRVIEKHGPIDEVLLVLDATTGQNGMIQAKVFGEVVDVTGIVLTKLDGTAKGGIVVAVQRELGVPVKLVGLGEGPDDLAPFDAEVFVDGILG
jgi:fused signal recognition particle receptor